MDVALDSEKDGKEEDDDEEDKADAVGRDLTSTYAKFVKLLAISLTFGLVSPMIGFVAAMGISCWSFALAYFVHVWEL